MAYFLNNNQKDILWQKRGEIRQWNDDVDYLIQHGLIEITEDKHYTYPRYTITNKVYELFPYAFSVT